MIVSLIIGLLVFVVSCGDQVINMYPVSGSGQPTTIVRQNQIKIRYTLVFNQDSIFPDMHDTFTLQTAQRVNIFYIITINSYPQQQLCLFRTFVKIDGKDIRPLDDMGYGKYQRTNKGNYRLWLEPGNHQVAVWYKTSCKVTNSPPNSEDLFWVSYGLMEIEYLKYPQ